MQFWLIIGAKHVLFNELTKHMSKIKYFIKYCLKSFLELCDSFEDHTFRLIITAKYSQYVLRLFFFLLEIQLHLL